MRLIRCLIAFAWGAILAPSVSAADPAPAGWKLIWSDEFDGDAIDPAKWDFDIGNGFYNYGSNTWISGWGNNELQYYTSEPANAHVAGGELHIRALKESLHGCGYTSAKLRTRKRDGSQLFDRTYGRYEFRAKLPTGQGVWPALWMLPQDEQYGGWAASGEIDVLEARGQKPTEVLGTIHYGTSWPGNTESSVTYPLPNGGRIDEWHVYAVEWDPGAIRWFVDGTKFAEQTFWWSSSRIADGKGVPPMKEGDLNPWPAPFDQPFHIVMNLAVGGRFLGNPDATTPFPAEMLVDYVRVYERLEAYGPPPPRGAGKLPFGS
jgi:beta-glucanase (GH16 family)